MPESIIESVLSGKLQRDLLFKWLNDELVEVHNLEFDVIYKIYFVIFISFVYFQTAPDDCILLCSNRNEFVSYFLSYLRDHTER